MTGSVSHTCTNTIILLTCGLTILYTVYVFNTIFFIYFERTLLHKYCYHKQHYIKSITYHSTNYTAQLYLQCNSTTSTQYSSILIWIVYNNYKAVSIEAVLESPGHQKVLSSRLADHQFRLLFQSLSLPNRARL